MAKLPCQNGLRKSQAAVIVLITLVIFLILYPRLPPGTTRFRNQIGEEHGRMLAYAQTQLLQEIEHDRLRLLNWTETDYVRMERHMGMPAGALPRSKAEYFARLRTSNDKWLSGTIQHAAVARSLDAHALRLVPENSEMNKNMFTMSPRGREGLPEDFVGWERVLGGRGSGSSEWTVEVMNDKQDMDRRVRKFVRSDENGSRGGSTGAGGNDRLQKIWDQLDFPVLRTDLLRYLVLLSEGGLYSDSDTMPRLHPDKWGKESLEVDTGLSRLEQELASVRSSRKAAQSSNHSATPMRESRFAAIKSRNTINDPEISVILSVDGVNGDGLTDNITEEWEGYPGIPYRRVEMSQWTMMAKKMHPIYVDVMGTVLDNLERAIAEDKLDGSIPVLTGPGPFSDAVFRYLLVQHGIDPISFSKMQNGKKPSLRFGDTILYAPWSFAGGRPEIGLEGIAAGAEDAVRPVSHAYRGQWKSQGWD